MISPQEVHELLLKGIPGCEAKVYDLKGTQDHYKVIVISKDFQDKSLVQRHQMVNQALKEPLKGPLHALTIEALTPDQWQNKGVAPQQPLSTAKPQGIKL